MARQKVQTDRDDDAPLGGGAPSPGEESLMQAGAPAAALLARDEADLRPPVDLSKPVRIVGDATKRGRQATDMEAMLPLLRKHDSAFAKAERSFVRAREELMEAPADADLRALKIAADVARKAYDEALSKGLEKLSEPAVVRRATVLPGGRVNPEKGARVQTTRGVVGVVRAGKEIDSQNYDFALLRQQGVSLELIEPLEKAG